MRVIFGIGNYGSIYENTRHNIGFMVLDKLAIRNKLDFAASKKDYYYAGSSESSSPFILVKPTTYVNLSGLAAQQIFEEFDIFPKDFLVILDDFNLEAGKIRLRSSGSDGGHNGLSSIIYHLNTDQFPRLRIGIGKTFNDGQVSDYVLGKFSDQESEIIKEPIEQCVDLSMQFLSGGAKTMFEYYSKNLNKRNNNPLEINSQEDNLENTWNQ